MTTRMLVAVLFCALTAPVTTAAEPHAVLFIYHRFGEHEHPSTNIQLDQLDAQLDYLEGGGYHVLSLHDIVKSISEGGTLPDRTVSITIDDAYRSIYDEAYPRLRDRGWPFTVFVCTDPVDGGLPGYLTWDQMREMAEHGATFANHSASHDALVDRRDGETEKDWAERVRQDVARAQQRLEKELGSAPMLFAYPYGEYDEPLAEMIVEMGYSAFGQQSGAVGVRSDTRSLPRYPMAEGFADLEGFKTKAASLPLDVTAVEPWDPVTTSRRPRLEVALADSNVRLDELACYVGGQGRVEVEWIEPGRRFAVQAERDLAPGRGRYNCTAPNQDRTRYHWLSRQWVVRP